MSSLLGECPLAELIHEISIERLSGALRLSRERAKAAVYTETGDIVFASSNLRAHRFAECLRRWGVVPDSKLSTLLIDGMSDADLRAALVTAGAVSEETLKELQAHQVLDVLRTVLLWTNGEWSFDPRARLAAPAGVTANVGQLLIESARRLPIEFVASRLTDDEEIISPANEAPAHLQLLPTEAFVLSRVDAPSRLSEIVMMSGLPDPETRRAIYALALGGFLSRENWPHPFSEEVLSLARIASKNLAAGGGKTTVTVDQREATDSATVAQDPEAEQRAALHELFTRANGADYYEVLGVGRNASNNEIKNTYHTLAKRFHPDRFRRDLDEEMRARIENAFAQIARAYETLKDWRARDAYNLKLEAQSLRPTSFFAPNVKSATPEQAHDRRSRPDSPSTTSPHASTSVQDQAHAERSFKHGLAALQKGNHVTAATNFREAAQFAPQQPRYRAFYGRALARDPRTRPQAEAELQAAIALDTRNPTYRVMLAELYRDLGQQLKAKTELERALSLDPEHTAARRLLDSLKNRG